jgi:MFS family permease
MKLQLFLLMSIRAIRGFLLTMPIIVLYWQDNGLTMQDIFLLQVIYSIALIILEIPTGYLSDVFGHKKSLISGSITSALGFYAYYAFPSFNGFVLAELLLALSTSFMSGARDALLYDTLQAHARTHIYTKIQGQNNMAFNFSEAAAAILAGVIATTVSVKAVFFSQWIIMAFAIPLSFMLTEYSSRQGRKTTPLLSILKGNFKENHKLLALNFFSGTISASTIVMVWLAQPHWKILDINILYFGYLWAFLNVVTGIGSFIAYYFEKKLSFMVLFGTMAFMPGILFLSTAFFSYSLWALCIIPFFWFLRGVSSPIMQDYVQRECEDGERATVLSINALIARFIFSIFSPFIGYATDVYSIQTAFYASGVIFGITTLVSYFVFLKMQQKDVIFI